MDSIALVARDAGVGEKAITDSRSYQIEMLQESLRHNIIVAVRRLSATQLPLLLMFSDGHGKWQDTYVRVLITALISLAAYTMRTERLYE